MLLLLLTFSNLSWGQAVPAHADEPLASARALFKQGKFQEAAAAYRRILQKDNPSASAYAGLVQSYLKMDDVSAADQASAQAVAQLPASALMHATRGDVYFRQGLLAEAEAEYRTALRLDEKCARALLGMGKIYSAVSMSQRAKDSFARARELDPHDGDAWYRWAVLLPFPESASELEKHLKENRSTAEAERHEREFIDLIKGIAGREVWVGPNNLETEIKLELLAPRAGILRGLGARVRFNNSVSATLMIDTGTHWITIPRKLAEKIGVRKISDYAIEGVGGEEPSRGYFAWVDKVTVGNVEFRDCVVHVSMKDGAMEDGLIGTNIFSHYLVEIDFPRRTLRLAPLGDKSLPSDEMLVRPIVQPLGDGQAFSFGHLLLLPTHVNQSTSGLFVLDSGANRSSISPDMAKRAGQLRSVLQGALLEFSDVPADRRDLLALEWRSVSRQLQVEVSGAIGFDALSRLRLRINYRDGWVRVEQSK